MAILNAKYIWPPPSLAKFVSQANAVSGGHLLQSEGVDGGDCSFEGS
jgi:hypothetical protein